MYNTSTRIFGNIAISSDYEAFASILLGIIEEIVKHWLILLAFECTAGELVKDFAFILGLLVENFETTFH